MPRRHNEEPTAAEPIRAWVLHPDLVNEKATRKPEHVMAEAMALARALPAINVVGGEVVRIREPHPGQLFGTGKTEEIAGHLQEADIGLAVVDGPLSPIQQRNLERIWKIKVLDRTGLILEIFADRAQTREGVLQVELAALAFQRTRLVRAWTHLERQRGGYGFVGGPGETQLEADRRAIDDHIVRLRRQLDRVVKTRKLHRRARARIPWPIVALVGYTNSGKSTLFNRLTGANVMVRDMLFATLDPTLRAIRLPDAGGGADGRQVMLSDTVGFISDLPHELVAAFRATLEEVLEADLILHVRDISHPETESQAADVAQILESLGLAQDVVQIEVWNKIDALPLASAGTAPASDGAADAVLPDPDSPPDSAPSEAAPSDRAPSDNAPPAMGVANSPDDAAGTDQAPPSNAGGTQSGEAEARAPNSLPDSLTREAVLAQAARRPDVVAVSALHGDGFDQLVAAIDAGLTRALDERYEEKRLSLGFDQGRHRAWLHEAGVVVQEDETADGWELHVRWTPRQHTAFDAL